MPSTPSAIRSYEVHPNPSADLVIASFDLRCSAHVRLRMIDPIGRVVAVPLDDAVEAGRHEVSVPTFGIPAGMYFFNLEIDGATVTRPLIIAH